MSKYTTEVRYICEKAAGLDDSKGFNDVDSIIESAIPNVFSFPFPIFDENYRNVICSKILRHYYTREIGFETVGLWKLKLQTKLTEIMPYYNQLYESELIKFNPMYDTDLHTTHVGDKASELNKEENKSGISTGQRDRSETGSAVRSQDNVESNNSTGTSKSDVYSVDVENGKNSKTNQLSESENRSSNKVDAGNYSDNENGNRIGDKVGSNNYSETEGDTHYDLYSDTPQGALDGVEDEEYLTNARKVTDSKSKSGKNDNTENSNEKYNSNKTGNTNATSIGNEDSSKSADGSETGTIESNKVGSSNVRDSFDESNDRTAITNETRKNDASATESDNRTSFDNMTGKDKFNSTESYVLHVVGKTAGTSYSKLLKEFRETFLNIDLEVINSLSDLFFNLW